MYCLLSLLAYWHQHVVLVQERLAEALPDVPARCLRAFYQQLASTGVLCSVTSSFSFAQP